MSDSRVFLFGRNSFIRLIERKKKGQNRLGDNCEPSYNKNENIAVHFPTVFSNHSENFNENQNDYPSNAPTRSKMTSGNSLRLKTGTSGRPVEKLFADGQKKFLKNFYRE